MRRRTLVATGTVLAAAVAAASWLLFHAASARPMTTVDTTTRVGRLRTAGQTHALTQPSDARGPSEQAPASIDGRLIGFSDKARIVAMRNAVFNQSFSATVRDGHFTIDAIPPGPYIDVPSARGRVADARPRDRGETRAGGVAARRARGQRLGRGDGAKERRRMTRTVLIAILLAACEGGGGGQKKAADPDKGGAAQPDNGGGGAQPDNGGGGAQPDNGGGAAQPGTVGAGNSGKKFPANTPAAQACKVDADCTVAVDAALGPDPCCNVTTTAMPIAVAYVQFMDRWQKANCAGVSCPPLSLPGAQTAPCGMRGRCDKGNCNNSCGLRPDGGPGPAPPP